MAAHRPVMGLAAALLGLTVVWVGPARADVYNIHLYTDSGPDYTTLESYLGTAISVWSDPQDQAIALWRWVDRHHKQTSCTKEDDRGIYDPTMFFNNYANTYCGYSAGFLETYWHRLGGDWRHRYLELGDHTVIEVSWDAGASWHLFDPSMGIYCLRHDGVVASAEEVTESHYCLLAERLGATDPEPGHYYLYHYAPECGSNPARPGYPDMYYPWGYRVAADDPVHHGRTLRAGVDSYLSGLIPITSFTHIRTGWRYRLHLRQNEHYTRYWTHLGESEDFFRPNTYDRDPDADYYVPANNLRGNGQWEFAPDLATAAYRDLVYRENGLVHRSEDGGTGPLLHPAAAGASAEVVFKVTGANIITSADIHLAGLRSGSGDSLAVSVSRDAGINWQPVWSATSTGPVVTDISLPAALLGGAWEYLVRVSLYAAGDRRDCGLEQIELITVTQVNPRALPKLVRGGNKVRFRLGEQVASHLLWPPLHEEEGQERHRESAYSWANVAAGNDGDEFSRSVIAPAVGGSPAHVTWRFTTPTPIVGLVYGGSFHVRDEGAQDYVDLLHSFDGAQFDLDGHYDAFGQPTMDGRLYADPTGLTPGQQEVWLRYEFMSNQDFALDSSGVQDALMYVEYEPRDPQFVPVEVTFCWTEHRRDGDRQRTHTRLVTDSEDLWQINVAGYRDPTMNWIRVNLVGQGPPGSPGPGYSDGENVGPGHGYDKVRYLYDLLDNRAYARPYSVSRPADPANPDDADEELTNGCLIPPTYFSTGQDVQVQTALWAAGPPVTVTVDLGQAENVAGVRLTTHQPNEDYCHPESVLVEISADDLSYAVLGTIHHDQVWEPPGDFADWDNVGSPDFVNLPAGGRLAFPFWLVPPQAGLGRYVRCTFTPRTGAGLSLSEVQVFSAVTVEDWPDREIDLPDITGIESETDPGGGQAQVATFGPLENSPNPFNAGTTIRYRLDRGGAMELSIYDLSGRRVRVLERSAFRVAGSYERHWDGKDALGRPAASGVYFCRLTTDWINRSIRLVLVK